MKKLPLLAALCLMTTMAQALPPAIEADKLLLEIKALRDLSQYAPMLEKFERIAALGVRVDDTFYYHWGVALLNAPAESDAASVTQLTQALAKFDKYLAVSGATGKFYREALEAYSTAEKKVNELKAVDTAKAAVVKKNNELKALNDKYSVGQSLRDCNSGCPEMVVVPAGSYMMGSSHEQPVHQVTIGYVLAVGRFEVTFDEWDACVADGGCNGYKPSDYNEGRGRRPVYNVSWGDAQAYVQWLGRKSGKAYRLLTESEWEYVARAGTTTQYSWGDEVGSNRANCDGCGSQWDKKEAAPVGSFAANGFGLYDVHGNVWEWVEDCKQYNYVGAPADGSARGSCTGSGAGMRVLRGGSWSNVPDNARSAIRLWNSSTDRGSYLGFRVARRL